MKEKTLEDYVKLIEGMRMPERLTAGLKITPKQQTVVDASVAEVKDKGYSTVPSFLTRNQIDDLCNQLDPIFAVTGNRKVDDKKRGWPGYQTVHIPNLYAKTRAIDELSIDPLLLFIVEGVLGRAFQMSVAVAMSPGPGSDKQGLHQDDGHYPVARPHQSLVANTLIALDDFTLENGATMLVPESHKWDKELDPKAEVSRVEMKAGSLHIWDGAVWHGGGENKTENEIRRSINLNFNVSWLRQQENQYIGISREVIRKMPERLQRLLEFLRICLCDIHFRDQVWL